MNADLYVRQGDTHAICEDYAEVRTTDRATSIAVCDGCSSSPRTDFGARLLARGALQEVERAGLDDVEAFGAATIDGVAEGACWLKLPRECLDSTLIVVDATADRSRAVIYGDGAVAVGYVDGSVKVWQVDYESNAPEYLGYRLDAGRRAAYRELVGSTAVTVDEIEWDGDGRVRMSTRPLSRALVVDVDEPVRWIAAMTDGVKSFTRPVRSTSAKGREPVDAVEVMREMLDFVNVNGKFVERQIRWFLGECDKRGWKHADDLSTAAVSFE